MIDIIMPQGVKGFQKNNTCSRGGLPSVVRKIKLMSLTDFIMIARELWFMPKEDLEKLINNPRESGARHCIARAILHPDYRYQDLLLSRLFGKVKEHIEITGSLNHTKLIDLIHDEKKQITDGEVVE